jgi:hypothetical protein
VIKVVQSNEFIISQKEKQHEQELAKEDIEKLFQIVKNELEIKKSRK